MQGVWVMLLPSNERRGLYFRCPAGDLRRGDAGRHLRDDIGFLKTWLTKEASGVSAPEASGAFSQ